MASWVLLALMALETLYELAVVYWTTTGDVVSSQRELAIWYPATVFRLLTVAVAVRYRFLPIVGGIIRLAVTVVVVQMGVLHLEFVSALKNAPLDITFIAFALLYLFLNPYRLQGEAQLRHNH